MTAPGDFTAGDVLQASDMNALPGGIISKTENTSDVNLTTSNTTVTTLSVPVVAGRSYLIGFTCRNMSANQANTIIDFLLNESGTKTNFRKFLVNTTARESLSMFRIHNIVNTQTNEYTVKASTNTGTGTLFGATYKMEMWAQDLGLHP
jgi:hypothetical protein